MPEQQIWGINPYFLWAEMVVTSFQTSQAVKFPRVNISCFNAEDSFLGLHKFAIPDVCTINLYIVLLLSYRIKAKFFMLWMPWTSPGLWKVNLIVSISHFYGQPVPGKEILALVSTGCVEEKNLQDFQRRSLIKQSSLEARYLFQTSSVIFLCLHQALLARYLHY